jgi:hypothetical protein
MGQPMGPLPAPMSRPMMPPTLDAMSGQPVSARPSPMPAPMPMTPPEPEPVNPFAMTPLGGYVDPTAAMVPSGFNAMNQRLATDPAGFPGLPMPPPGLYGPEAPPLVDVARLPGTDYVAPIFGGKVSAQTLPMAKPEAPLPPGLMPTEANRGGVTYKAPGADKPAKPPTLKQIYEGDVQQNVQWNEQRGRWERVKIYNPGDPDDNGIPGDQSAGAGAGSAAAAAAPSALDKLRALRQRAGGQ